jgi:hypothetical protein
MANGDNKNDNQMEGTSSLQSRFGSRINEGEELEMLPHLVHATNFHQNYTSCLNPPVVRTSRELELP